MNDLNELRDFVASNYDLTQQSERRRSVSDAVDLMFALAKVANPSVCLEVGAFQATFSRRCAREFESAAVLALEANPYNWDHFAPGMDPNVEYILAAAAAEDGDVTFRVQRRKSQRDLERVRGDNSIMSRSQAGVEYEDVTVPGRALDSLMAERGLLGVPSVVWMDVEGAQGAVIAGGSRTIGSAHLLLIEVETRRFWEGQILEPEVHEILSGLGLVAVTMDFEYGTQHNILYSSAALLRSRNASATVEAHLSGVGRG